jgi:hypothetical protein
MKLPLALIARQGLGGTGTTVPSPLQRCTLLLLAVDQYNRHTAALLPNSAPNRHNCNRQAMSALRAAVQQQVTPSCCSQVLQRSAPAWWAARAANGLPRHIQSDTMDQIEIICNAGMSTGLDSVEGMCGLYVPSQEPFHALGEWGAAAADRRLGVTHVLQGAPVQHWPPRAPAPKTTYSFLLCHTQRYLPCFDAVSVGYARVTQVPCLIAAQDHLVLPQNRILSP